METYEYIEAGSATRKSYDNRLQERMTLGTAVVAFVMAAVAVSRMDSSTTPSTSGTSLATLAVLPVNKEPIANDYKASVATLVGTHPFCGASTEHFRICAELIDAANDMIDFHKSEQPTPAEFEAAVTEGRLGSPSTPFFASKDGVITAITPGLVARAGDAIPPVAKTSCVMISKDRVCVQMLLDQEALDYAQGISTNGTAGKARIAVVIDPASPSDADLESNVDPGRPLRARRSSRECYRDSQNQCNNRYPSIYQTSCKGYKGCPSSGILGACHLPETLAVKVEKTYDIIARGSLSSLNGNYFVGQITVADWTTIKKNPLCRTECCDEYYGTSRRDWFSHEADTACHGGGFPKYQADGSFNCECEGNNEKCRGGNCAGTDWWVSGQCQDCSCSSADIHEDNVDDDTLIAGVSPAPVREIGAGGVTGVTSRLGLNVPVTTDDVSTVPAGDHGSWSDGRGFEIARNSTYVGDDDDDGVL